MGHLITAKEYANKVGVNRSVVLRKIYSGILPAQKDNVRNMWLIDSDEAWVDMRYKANSRRWNSPYESLNDGINACNKNQERVILNRNN